MTYFHQHSAPDPRQAPEIAPRPTYGLWDAIFFLDHYGTSLSEADEVIFGHWDDYADETIKILHRMIQQTERLVFSDDEYTDLVRTFRDFPHRPNLSTVLRDATYDEPESVVTVVANLALTPVQKAWHTWASRVEEVHRGLAEKMSRCKLQLAKQDEGGFGLASLCLSSDLPKAEGLTSLVHKILDSASEPDEEPHDPGTGLEADLQLMGF